MYGKKKNVNQNEEKGIAIMKKLNKLKTKYKSMRFE
jgi:hypothetical protein